MLAHENLAPYKGLPGMMARGTWARHYASRTPVLAARVVALELGGIETADWLSDPPDVALKMRPSCGVRVGDHWEAASDRTASRAR